MIKRIISVLLLLVVFCATFNFSFSSMVDRSAHLMTRINDIVLFFTEKFDKFLGDITLDEITDEHYICYYNYLTEYDIYDIPKDNIASNLYFLRIKTGGTYYDCYAIKYTIFRESRYVVVSSDSPNLVGWHFNTVVFFLSGYGNLTYRSFKDFASTNYILSDLPNHICSITFSETEF